MQKLELPERTSGILLHPTSLPGPHGIGSLGRSSYRFVDFLVGAQQTLWQILPLSPPGFGDSPYSAFCSVAGNPLLISLSQLVHAGDLEAEDTGGMPLTDPCLVDYETVGPWKMLRLEKAARNVSADRGRPTPAQLRGVLSSPCQLARRLRAVHGDQGGIRPARRRGTILGLQLECVLGQGHCAARAGGHQALDTRRWVTGRCCIASGSTTSSNSGRRCAHMPTSAAC